MQSKAAAKRKTAPEDETKKGDDGEGAGVPNKDQADRRRTFKQIPLAKKRKQEEQPEQVQRVLSKIF
jgi:ESF2/ABP1 family protein